MPRLIALLLIVLAFLATAPLSGAQGEAFLGQLNEALERTEKSIKLAREQIVQSQTAPFLPQLYMQLAELLSQKSNTLYYIKMERDSGSAVPDVSDKAFSPVLQAQQEAISIYRLLLKDFPQFPRRMQVMLRLATALKSIDETGEFIRISSELLQQYPQAEDSTRVRLLLGQYYFDKRQEDLAMRFFLPVAQSRLVYERNLARYRIGLLHISKEKFREALAQFEEIIRDEALKDQENPYELSLKKTRKAARADLKRDALLDSIRAYTYVYDKNPDPVGYYSKLAPTEIHFQEIIEKLSLRYIHLKKYDTAVKLLRILSERTADPQKIMAVYQEVLLMIPPRDRILVPADEIQFVFEKYNAWSSFYDIPKATQALAYNFFEKQIRDFGTTAHSYAKAEKDPARKAHYLNRARDFYRLYLGYFWTSPNAVKMATNLGDVYFAQTRYLESGDIYLRTALGEFGVSKDKVLLVENAILCFEKKQKYTFFEDLRVRGLLIEAIDQYSKLRPARKNDPKLMFAKLKAEYEQGFFPEVLEACFEYMRKFRKAPQAVEAGELILDYFNTRSEYAGLENWSSRMLGLKLPHVEFNRKLQSIGRTARSRVLGEKVKSFGNYDAFAQGKSYLAAASSFEDQRLSSEALKQALARSKAERDIETFLGAAAAMAKNEKDPGKKAQIQKSIARENLRVTRFHASRETYKELAANAAFPAETRRQAVAEELNIALAMRDWRGVLAITLAAGPRALDASTANRVREHLADVLLSPVKTPPEISEALFRLGLTDETLLALYKSQEKLPAGLRSRIANDVSARCSSQSRQLHCRWMNLERMEGQLDKFRQRLGSAPRDLRGIEAVAQEFAVVTNQLQSLEGSGDPLLETTLSMMSSGVYLGFAGYLRDAAGRSADLRAVLLQKAADASSSARLYQDRCRGIGGRDASLKPRTDLCKPGGTPSVRAALRAGSLSSPPVGGSDPSDRDINDLRKVLFAEKADASHVIQLALLYLKGGAYHHAVGTASFGLSQYKDSAPQFKTLLGCALAELGLTGEAIYHLRTGSDVPGTSALRERCYVRINEILGDS